MSSPRSGGDYLVTDDGAIVTATGRSAAWWYATKVLETERAYR